MPKRPWNQVNLPVYSLATLDSSGVPNFNMCTYVTAISLKPKLFAVAVYEGTKTLENLIKNPDSCNLQVLSLDCINLFRVLGKQSGKDIDKQKLIEKKGFNVTSFKNAPAIKEVVSVMNMSIQSYQKQGDHTLFIMKVESFSTINQTPILYTQDLIDKRLIL